MLYPDLMLTKAVSLERAEQQRHPRDRYAVRPPSHVYRRRRLPLWLQRVQAGVAKKLVTWGEKLQAYNAAPSVQAANRSRNADHFETIQVRR